MDVRTLYSLAAVLLLVQLPHVSHLPIWVSLLGGTIVGLRLLYHKHANHKLLRFTLSPITLTLTAALTAVLIRYDFGYSFGRDPCVAFLFVLVAAKFAEIRRASDATLLLCLASFLLLTQYFYSQTIIAALFTLPAIVAIAFALSILRDSKNPANNSAQIRLVTKLLLHGLPLAALLFFIFPRLPGPLWSLPEDAMATTGLSDSMSPGSIGDISKSAAVAFRVEFDEEPPAAHQLYWRGPVLTEFDGRNWTISKRATEVRPPRISNKENQHAYTVMLQPHRQRWLFALEAPSSLPRADTITNNQGGAVSSRLLGRLMADGQLISDQPVSQVLRYRQTSSLSNTLKTRLPPPANTLFLPGKNPKTIQYAKELRASSRSDLQFAQRILKNFNQDQFRYTLQPQLLGDAPVDEFLFNTKSGFCEHYSAAFVVLMRAAGIPARVVTGYLGGEMNGDYMIVRQSDAHAWSEAFIDGVWMRFDPTGYVAPSRVEQGLSAALPDESAVPALARLDASWLRETQLRWDALNHQWQRLVVNFDNSAQDKFWERLGLLNLSLLEITLMVIFCSLLWSLLILRSSWVKQKDLTVIESLWRKLCQLLKTHQLHRAPDESATELLQRAAMRWPNQQERFNKLQEQFSQARFQKIESAESDKLNRSIRKELLLLEGALAVSKLKPTRRSRKSRAKSVQAQTE